MLGKSRLLRVTVLCFLLLLLMAMAIVSALFSMNVLKLPAYEELDKFLTNVGYGVIAGTILVLLVAIIERLWTYITSKPESQ